MVGELSLSQKEVSPSVGALFRASTSGSFAPFSLVGALYLIVALIVPGAFLIAKEASLLSSSSPSHLSLTSASSTEEDGGEDSWTGPKRLRGVLPSKVGGGEESFVGSLLAALPVLVATTPILEPAERVGVVAEDARPLQDGVFPQELLGRGPPSSLS